MIRNIFSKVHGQTYFLHHFGMAVIMDRKLGTRMSILLGATIYSVGTLLTYLTIKVSNLLNLSLYRCSPLTPPLYCTRSGGGAVKLFEDELKDFVMLPNGPIMEHIKLYLICQ